MPAKIASYYREGIIFFGILLPVLAFGAVVGGAYYASDKAAAYLAEKKGQYSTYEKSRKGMQQLEEVFGKKKPFLESWENSMKTDTRSAFSGHLGAISAQFSPEEFFQSTIDPSDTPSGFGAVSAQRSSMLRLSTRGTFRATQKAMLMLETEMPQLQLQELKIDPSTTSSSALNFQFGYTAWEK